MGLKNEDKLIIAAQSDPQSFAQIYEYYFPKIYNYLRSRVPNIEIADDLTADVFNDVIDNLDKFDSSKGSFSTWLFTIAHNVVVDYYKHRNKTVNNVSLEVVANSADSQINLEDKLINQELRKSLLLALKKISERKRNLLTLKFWGGLTNRRIAEITGLTESNVGVIVYRTVKELKSILERMGCDIDEGEGISQNVQ
ncbi:MAG: RNA polymerase sigma factor [Bacillota bacterium]